VAVLEESVLAYTAGILDGEGYLGCWIEHNSYRERITVHMKYDKIPNWLLSHWKGYVCHRVDESFTWNLSGQKMRELLIVVLPYMVEKRRQAQILLEFGELKKQNVLFQADTPELKDQKHKLYLELKGLHH